MIAFEINAAFFVYCELSSSRKNFCPILQIHFSLLCVKHQLSC